MIKPITALLFVSCLFWACTSSDDVIPEPQPEPEPTPPVIRYAEYESNDDYVDLGVGDFVIATKNLGAKRPEDVGDFYAWGETEPKDDYSWETYKLQTSQLYYKKDGLLLSSDDAATVALGSEWRMPKIEEVKLLHDSYTTDEACCRMRPTVKNGVYGFELIGTNGNSVFFPSTGRKEGKELITRDNDTKLWCKDCSTTRELTVFTIEYLGATCYYSVDRCEGLPIRPVKDIKEKCDTVYLKLNVLDRNIEEAKRLLDTKAPEEYTAETYQSLYNSYQYAVGMRDYVVENDGQKVHTYLGNINKTNIMLQDSIDKASHFLRLALFDLRPMPKAVDVKAVDLGLSVRWASVNLGALTENEYGYFISWGELAPKAGGLYDWEGYKFCEQVGDDRDYSKFSKYVTDSRWGEIDGKSRLELEDDAAHQFLGGNWRIPTTKEFQELIDNCSFENVTLYGKTVTKATGPNGNYIYFPHTGSTVVIDNIYCWTSDLRTFANNTAVAFSIDAFWAKGYETYEKRCAGLPIRAVCP